MNVKGKIFRSFAVFCYSESVKLPFTGQKSDFHLHEIDLKACHLKHPLTLKDVIEDGREKKLLEKVIRKRLLVNNN